MEQSKIDIKVNFVDFCDGFNPENNPIIRSLRKYFNVEVSDEADYVFFSCFGEQHWQVSDSCIKIFITGENYCPDFNACDYGIGFEYMNYEDRYFRQPFYISRGEELNLKMQNKHILPEDFDLALNKPEFCSFVVSNGINQVRNNAFHALTNYKHVNSGGRYLNNIGGPIDNKLAFEGRHKFSLCFENGTHSGYTTEKIVEAFAAQTVPIYWGDPNVGRQFNEHSFINANKFKSLDEMVEFVKLVDNDDELYLKMLRTPALLPESKSYAEELFNFERWLTDIFNQPINEAYRRPRYMFVQQYIDARRFETRWHRQYDRLKALLNSPIKTISNRIFK